MSAPSSSDPVSGEPSSTDTTGDGLTEPEADVLTVLRALSNEHRLAIMGWLMDPRAHFPRQRDGDLVEDGVCVGFITQKIGLKQPTVTTHMQTLAAAGLVTSKKIKNWVFYKPDRAALEDAMLALSRSLGSDKVQ